MRISISDNTTFKAIEFKTKAEWDEFRKPWTRIEDGGTWQWGTYVPAPYSTPDTFPCLMLYDEDRIITNPNGRDWFVSIILDKGDYAFSGQ